MEIQIIDVDSVTRMVSFKLKPRKITGISRLMQIVILSLLNVPGQDVLDPSLGGGLPAMLGMNISPNDSTEVYGEAVQRVKKTEREVLAAQIGLDDPPEERLRGLQVVDLRNGEDGELLVRIRVINEVGQASDMVV